MRKTCLDQIYQLAKKDPRVVFIGSDIASGTLEAFRREMPGRFFMEGVSEQHLVGFMAGLAMEGKIPYLNTIASFITRRPFEQILLDAGLHEARVRLVGSGGGVVYAPLGPTHLSVEDIAILRTIPGMAIVAPCDAEEMKRLMPKTLDWPGPMYIRLAKGGDPVVSRPDLGFEIGQGILLEKGSEALIVSTGVTTQIALQAAAALKRQNISAAVLHLHTLKPVDVKGILSALAPVRAVLTIEEHTLIGGLGSIVAEIVAEANFDRPKKFARIGIPDEFCHSYGSQNDLFKKFGITAEHAVKNITAMLRGE